MGKKKTKTQSEVMEMRQLLLQKKSELLTATKSAYKVEGMFRHFPARASSGIDIRDASMATLEEIARTLVNAKEARAMLGLEPQQKFGNGTLAEWEHDVKLRASKLREAQTIQMIDSLQKELSTLLTPEELREIGITTIKEKLESITG